MSYENNNGNSRPTISQHNCGEYPDAKASEMHSG